MKMTFRMALLILLAAISSSSLAWAADDVNSLQDISILSLAKARELTLAKSASLRKAELAVNAASLVKQAQDYNALPSLTATTEGDYSSSNSSSNEVSGTVGISASATIFDGGKNAALSKKYELATEAARQSLLSTRLTLISYADSAFFTVLEDEALVEAASSDLETAKIQLEIAKIKVETGALSKVDYLLTQSETASYQATLDQAKKSLASARAQLASLTGLPASIKLEEVDFSAYDNLFTRLIALDDTGIEALTAQFIASARKNSPALSSYALATSQASKTLDATKSTYLPTVTASVAQSVGLGSSSSLYHSGSLTVSASLALDFWVTKNSVNQAQIALQQAQLDVVDAGTTLDLEVSQALYALMSSALAIPSNTKALEYAQSNYENVLEKFKLSNASTSDLSTAEALVSTDKTALISARYTFLSNLSTLRGLVGLEDDSKLLDMLLS